MKITYKIFCMLVFAMILFSISNQAQAAIFQPEWVDYCPMKYYDSDKNKNDKEETYWYKRRLEFEKSLKKCPKYNESEMEKCFNKIREEQIRKNNTKTGKI